MATNLIALDEIERMAKYCVDSALFGVKTVPQAVSLMLLCQAKGMHPMEAVEEFHIIQGRPAMKAERMQSKFQAAGGKIEWHELTDERADATFSHPAGGHVRISWDLERAKRAGLAGKEVWKSYGRAMLRARVISEGIKSVLPGVAAGVYTLEEIIDIPPEGGERDITPAKPLTGVAAIAAKVIEKAAPTPSAGDPAAGLPITSSAPGESVDADTGELIGVTFAEVDALMAKADTDEARADCIDLARHLPEEQRVMLRKKHGTKFKAKKADQEVAAQE